MPALSDRLASGKTVLHIDALDYGERLLANGCVDWSGSAPIADFIGKVQSLLPSDIVLTPLARIAAAVVEKHSDLRAAMAKNPDGPAPLKALLSDELLRTLVADALAVIGAKSGDAVLCLEFPGPAAFAGLATDLAGLPAPEIDEDLVDDAALYLADFLRCLSESGIGAVALIDDTDNARWAEFYTPILRVAANYEWDVVVKTGPGLANTLSLETVTLADNFWAAEMAAPTLSGLVQAHVPSDGQPEAVLAAVSRLRSAA